MKLWYRNCSSLCRKSVPLYSKETVVLEAGRRNGSRIAVGWAGRTIRRPKKRRRANPMQTLTYLSSSIVLWQQPTGRFVGNVIGMGKMDGKHGNKRKNREWNPACSTYPFLSLHFSPIPQKDCRPIKTQNTKKRIKSTFFHGSCRFHPYMAFQLNNGLCCSCWLSGR